MQNANGGTEISVACFTRDALCVPGRINWTLRRCFDRVNLMRAALVEVELCYPLDFLVPTGNLT